METPNLVPLVLHAAACPCRLCLTPGALSTFLGDVGSCSGRQLDCALDYAVLLGRAGPAVPSHSGQMVECRGICFIRFTMVAVLLQSLPRHFPVEVQPTSSWLLHHPIVVSLPMGKANGQCILHTV